MSTMGLSDSRRTRLRLSELGWLDDSLPMAKRRVADAWDRKPLVQQAAIANPASAMLVEFHLKLAHGIESVHAGDRSCSAKIWDRHATKDHLVRDFMGNNGRA